MKISEKAAVIFLVLVIAAAWGFSFETYEATVDHNFALSPGGSVLLENINGDVTIDMVLNAYERMQREYPREDTRHRIEHCSLVNPELLTRIRAVGAVPTPFYTYVHYHGNKWIE